MSHSGNDQGGDDPVRVLHVVESWPPVVSGYSSRGAALVGAQLDRADLSPRVLVTSRQGVYGQGVPEPLPGQDPGHLVAAPVTARERRVRRFRAFDLDRPALQRAVREAAGALDAQLIHCHWSSGIGDACAAAAGELGLPLVAEVRFDLAGAMTTETLRVDLAPVENLFRRRFERYLAQADAVVAASGTLGGLLARTVAADAAASGRGVHVLPNGTDGLPRADAAARSEARRGLGVADGDFLVGTTSNQLRYEGLDRLLAAAAEAARTQPSVRVLVVGGGHGDDRLRAQAAGLDLRVDFTGRLPHEEVPPLLAAMDLFAVPRRDASITRFAAPIKLVEAMAAGRACLASAVGDIPDLLADERGLCLDPADDAALAAAIAELAADPARVAALGAAAAGWIASQPTWADGAARYAEIYRGVLAGTPAPVRPLTAAAHAPLAASTSTSAAA